MPQQWEHRVEIFGMEWRRQERLPDAEGLAGKLNQWGAEGWELVTFELVRDEKIAAAQAEVDTSPTAAYLVILKRPRPS